MPYLENIPAGWRGTKATIRRMRELASQDARKWKFIVTTTRMVHGCPDRDKTCWLRKLLAFDKSFVQFIPDPRTKLEDGGAIELVQAPLQTLHRRAGDCDDFSTLIAGQAMALGLPAAFRTIKADTQRPNEFSHVYAIVKVGSKWYGMDGSVKRSAVGWEPPIYRESQDWRI